MASVNLIVLVLILVGIAFFAFKSIKGQNGLKIMVFGIELTLIGGIIAIDPNSNLVGFEYLICLLGLMITILGLGRE